MNSSIKVLIADDHGIVRSGLRRILATGNGIQVVGEAANGDETLALVEREPANVLLLDMSMPGPCGVELIQRVNRLAPRLPVLVLSMHNEGPIVSRALKAGAAGYVAKDSDPEVLISAVRRVASGGRYIDAALVDSVVFHPEPVERHQQLSPRELQVLEGIVVGKPLGDIADELQLSPKTVSTHKMRLMQKLGVSTTADLLKYALRHGIASA
jgi:DNA-binding NarL/FixJ family response regulator